MKGATQGQGRTTEFKLRGIQAAITVTMRVMSRPGMSRFPYWHIDLNSGCGTNAISGCDGSPLAFLQAAEACGLTNYRALFCDIEQDAIDELALRIGQKPNCTCFWGNNREALPMVAEQIRRLEHRPHLAMGTVLCDPNGYFYGDAVPSDELADFCREFPRIDVILNLNIRTRRMIRGNIEMRRTGWDKACLGVDELPAFLSREHWLIRNLISKGGSPFILMVGRNFRIGDHRALGFHHLASAEGRAIIGKVERHQDEVQAAPQPHQHELFGMEAV